MFQGKQRKHKRKGDFKNKEPAQFCLEKLDKTFGKGYDFWVVGGKAMKGFKAFNNDLTCRGFQYEIGKTYEMEETPKLCKRGFHFCRTIAECYNYYDTNTNTRICEVEALGEINTKEDEGKLCTNKIKILNEVTTEWQKKGNATSRSTGFCNTGNCNTGNWNTGNGNAGNCNTGDWNAGNWNTGLFCTDKNSTIKMFDKKSNWTMQDWLKCRARYILSKCPMNATTFINKNNMTGEEKREHPECEIIGGYLKIVTVNNADKQAWWNDLEEEERQEVLNLPNFDKNIFLKCTGIKID